MKAAILDYGAGNLHSLAKALEGAGATTLITTEWDEALAADALVLPGVGAFGQAVGALPSDGTRLRTALHAGLPCLGICLGMQLLFDRSEESGDDRAGIGVAAGSVTRLEARVVPHMGWNDVDTAADPLFAGIDGLIAYYANSFVCEPEDDSTVIAWSTYEGRRFPAAIRVANTWGVQFHPEKSSTDGRRIISNFVEATQAILEARSDS